MGEVSSVRFWLTDSGKLREALGRMFWGLRIRRAWLEGDFED
jgi:hypothetical protein